MVKLFAGYDPRERVGFHTFLHSVLTHASRPVSVLPLAHLSTCQGSNAFTISRFLVPYLMGFKGHAIFCDASDMLCLQDIAELDALFDPQFSVQVVKHKDYQTRHPIKYRGTDMECPNLNYSRKNWASVMLLNCEHEEWRGVTPATIGEFKNLELLRFDDFECVGDLPEKWNRLVDEGQSLEGAAIAHWTAGIPFFDYYANAPGAKLWWDVRYDMTQGPSGPSSLVK